MNKAELVSDISKRSGLTKIDAEKALDAFIESVKDTLTRGEEIRLVGFGTFSTTRRAESDGRNPRTGAPIKIPASTNVKFRTGKGLKDSVNKR